MNWLYERVYSLLSLPHYWRAVEALAAELMASKEIGERRTRQIIRDGLADARHPDGVPPR